MAFKENPEGFCGAESFPPPPSIADSSTFSVNDAYKLAVQVMDTSGSDSVKPFEFFKAKADQPPRSISLEVVPSPLTPVLEQTLSNLC